MYLAIASIRDIAIIFLAIESIIIGIILVFLIIEIRSLAILLQNDVHPILKSTDETVRTVRGTSVFVSDSVIKPVVRISSVATGVATTLRILARRGQ